MPDRDYLTEPLRFQGVSPSPQSSPQGERDGVRGIK